MPALATMMPDQNDPNHFKGSATVMHVVTPEEGGEQVIDWKVTWDVERARR